MPARLAARPACSPGSACSWPSRPACRGPGLQTFVAANPVSHLVTAERSLFYGHPSARQIALVLAASAVLAAVFAPVTAWLYGRQR